MSFSTDVRREIARVACDKKCCILAELNGAILAGNGLTFKGMGRYGLSIETDEQETAQRYIAMFKRAFSVECTLSAVQVSRLGGRTHYVVMPPESEIAVLLSSLCLLDAAQPFGMRSSPDPALIEKDCCRRAFLRGVFLVGGSTGNPEKAYHFEMAAHDVQLAECIFKLLRTYELPVKQTVRKTQHIVYIKDGESMCDALTLLGAHRAKLIMEDLRIFKDLRNEANRQANCDNANLDKVVAAAERQMSIIQTIEKKLGLTELPAPLRDIAELRIKYPDATLTELGGMATPAIGKSGVNARMRKLEALAEELVNQ